MVRRAGLRYQAAQDYTEDGAFVRAFLSFVMGVDLSKQDASRVANCLAVVRGKTGTFYVDRHGGMSMGGATENIVLAYESGAPVDEFFRAQPGGRLAWEGCS
ncbi:hypothetical protein [Deinococcus sp. QL22]|uniref:hypothetical protein n=1 Tax=Deinococcus sp. QL22 TaxID=2939437 RepID=UPI002016B174|nr:hypothetical protein [Deinococcus sp. QL22]UQN06517.1 hypothetical protein M1R55_00945 [Deinococcus sp. QL22]